MAKTRPYNACHETHGRQKPLKGGGGDLSREVWHNKCSWYKNDRKT